MLSFRFLCGFLSIKLVLLCFSLSIGLFFSSSCFFSYLGSRSLLGSLCCKCLSSDLFLTELSFSSLLTPVFLDSLFKSGADFGHLLITEASLWNMWQWINIFEDGGVTLVALGIVGAVHSPGVCGYWFDWVDWCAFSFTLCELLSIENSSITETIITFISTWIWNIGRISFTPALS